MLFGLASYGQEGAAAVLTLLHEEFSLCMALNGARRVGEITRDLVVPGRQQVPLRSAGKTKIT